MNHHEYRLLIEKLNSIESLLTILTNEHMKHFEEWRLKNCEHTH